MCVLEVYAAVAGGCKLALGSPLQHRHAAISALAPLEPSQTKSCGYPGPIDARQAQALHGDDKRLIDRYIEAMPGGFERLNDAVARAIIEAAANKF